ncbi:hypothetical protein [Rhizobium leguminosarum]|uniref:hypothetical protein n=1 Tax=Rhizobium leguminosarum TaxID=384 RepID=UPI00143F0A0B|nr:hypothetical protein [Rhizobium leguminosarum]NKL24763.1 hypothetical protein [Rhizobium leguminosarum bv. viciae]
MVEGSNRKTSLEGRRLTAQTIVRIAIAELGQTLVSMVPIVGSLAQTLLFGIRKALDDEHTRLDLQEVKAELAGLRQDVRLPALRDVASDISSENAYVELEELMSSIDENDFRLAVAAANTLITSARPEFLHQTDPRLALMEFEEASKPFHEGANRALDALTSWSLEQLPGGRRRELIEVLLSMRRELLSPPRLIDVYDADVVHAFLTAGSWEGFSCFDLALQSDQTIFLTPEHFEEVRLIVHSLLRQPPIDPGRIFGLTNRIGVISQKAGARLRPYDNPCDQSRAQSAYQRILHDRPRANGRAIQIDARSLARLRPKARLITVSAHLARLGDTDTSLFPAIQQSYGAAWGRFRKSELVATDDRNLVDAIESFLEALLKQQPETLISIVPSVRETILRSVEDFHQDTAQRLRATGEEVAKIGPRLALLFHTRIDEFIDAIEKIAVGLKTFDIAEAPVEASE